jgi:hypothetical protein
MTMHEIPKRSWRWTVAHFTVIGFLILAFAAAFAINRTYVQAAELNREQATRSAEICEGQNVIKDAITDYLTDLGKGSATAAAPIPDDLPDSFVRFIVASRTSAADFNAKAAAAAAVRFAQANCGATADAGERAP